ncbi:superoxide dismutase [Candidatus Micrarchaeota archaeon]|nr:superoxide dismutase [Candidatus Micrarchaeota archaeon]
MAYEAKNFDGLLGMEGFSDNLLKNHFTLYQGYVTNTNKLSDSLLAMAKEGKAGTLEYSELKRRFGWEFNGMRLHEYYFGNMKKGGSAIDANGALAKMVVGEFGSLENWERDFRAVGAMRGIGWVVLYYDANAKRLFNCWVNEHDTGHLSGAIPLLVMDVFEHAFMLDYGLKRADYINSFFRNIDWKEIEGRFGKAMR